MPDDATTKLMLAQMNKKSLVTGLALTFFFGGLGLLYASTTGGIVMTILELIGLVLIFVAIGFVLLPVLHIVSMVWTVIAINNHNKKLFEVAAS